MLMISVLVDGSMKMLELNMVCLDILDGFTGHAIDTIDPHCAMESHGGNIKKI